MTVHPLPVPAPGYDDLCEVAGIRLLANWHCTGAPESLGAHLDRLGPMPLPSSGGRGGGHAPLIAAVEESGLTGRGGAAFPTGRKMRTVANGRGTPVFVANAMESEPASHKDETLLEFAPHLVLAGAALAAAAIGADTVHLCLPRTRSWQATLLGQAIEERRRRGVDWVPVRLHPLPHHYVASEETALVNWLNGGEARPTATPPPPFEKGVRGRPTLVDNVETLAHVALVARHGPEWFRRAGRADTPGTGLFTVTGAVRYPGVYEAAMGRLLGEILHLAGGRTEPLQAVLVGGFFASWLPAEQARAVPFTKDDLAALGAGPGAGVLFALPRDACGLIETARVLLYLAANSAQQCGPCRFGLPAVADDFARLARGRTDEALWERLTSRTALLAGRGACRHPDGAARLAATALSAFESDADAHLAGPASSPNGGRCWPFPCPGSLRIDRVACDGHGLCAELVPELIRLDEWGYPVIPDPVVTDRLKPHARRAVAACPVLALRLEAVPPATR